MYVCFFSYEIIEMFNDSMYILRTYRHNTVIMIEYISIKKDFMMPNTFQ